MHGAQGKGLDYSSKLMAVGHASMDGVLVHGKAHPIGLSAFEAFAGSSAHRPAQFTFTSSGLSLQVRSSLASFQGLRMKRLKHDGVSSAVPPNSTKHRFDACWAFSWDCILHCPSLADCCMQS